MLGSFPFTGIRSIQNLIIRVHSPLLMEIENMVFMLAILILIEKMCRELSGSDDILRRKVLIEVNEDFH